MAASDAPAARPRRRSGLATIVLILALSMLWMLFSGKFDALHLGYGVLSVGLVLLLSRNLAQARNIPHANEFWDHIDIGRALVYPAWLLWQVLLANIQVSWLIIRPSLPIQPVILRFKTRMRSPVAKVTLGNSITLTPGTFTLRIDGDMFVVHSIHEKLAAGLLDGSMQNKVARVFGEPELETVDVTVIRDLEAFLREEGI